VKNYPLLRKTKEHIEAHPEEHDQRYWGLKGPCGTTMCFAGHAVVLAGLKPIWSRPGDIFYGEETHMIAVVEEDGSRWSVQVGAARALGLGPDEAEELFQECGTLHQVQRVVGAFLAEEGGEGDDGVE
jgi:hypothetical protein